MDPQSDRFALAAVAVGYLDLIAKLPRPAPPQAVVTLLDAALGAQIRWYHRVYRIHACAADEQANIIAAARQLLELAGRQDIHIMEATDPTGRGGVYGEGEPEPTDRDSGDEHREPGPEQVQASTLPFKVRPKPTDDPVWDAIVRVGASHDLPGFANPSRN
jgi:xanthosine utilization system XapX-like protein